MSPAWSWYRLDSGLHFPFALSLSKGLQGFDKLSPNGTNQAG